MSRVSNIKPKLVFFRWIDKNSPHYIRLHLEQHIKCLSEFFEVILIDSDCDYKQVCDQYQPDLTLFESGVYVAERNIKNISAYPEIPKLGFCNADAYCETRSVFLSDMERWNIKTYFTLSVSMAEYIPEIANNLFVWPNFIDSDIYRDYGEPKVIPVFFSGSLAPHYPWRNKISRLVSQYYPTLICPHFGWFNKQKTSRMLYGERYARMINASFLAPTCGTIAKEIVRKHFEIPACRACLVTEETQSVKAAGFIDMQNCVFVDKEDVIDKIDYLFRFPDELSRITEAGYHLVHSRHTLKQRNQIFQWFELNKTLKPNEKIVQLNPFEPLVVVDNSSGLGNIHPISHGLDRILIHDAERELLQHNYKRAEELYITCLNYHSMPEPILGLALCKLYTGNSAAALNLIYKSIQKTIEGYKAADPDPIEWAYYIISLLCQGKMGEAVQCSHQFLTLHHLELERARVVIDVLNQVEDGTKVMAIEHAIGRPSVHQLPLRSFTEWIDNVCIMLKACGQSCYAEALKNVVWYPRRETMRDNWLKRSAVWPNRSSIDSINRRFSSFVGSLYVKLCERVLGVVKSVIRRPLRYLMVSPKGFQWYLSTKARLLDFLCRLEKFREKEGINNEFLVTVEDLAQKEDIDSVLIIDASPSVGKVEAVIAGVKRNPNKPVVFLVASSEANLIKFKVSYLRESFVKLCDSSLKEVKEENHIKFFGMALIGGTKNIGKDEYQELVSAKLILIDNLNREFNHILYQRLLVDSGYRLLTQDPSQQIKFAIFRRLLVS